MMTLQGKEGLNSLDWRAIAELIAASGLGQRDISLLEQAFRHSTFCWFGFENGQLVAVARAISDLTGAAIWPMWPWIRVIRDRVMAAS